MAGFFSGRSKICPAIVLLLYLIAPTPPVLANDADDLRDRLDRLSPYELDEVLWLARCIYSESNRKHEQRLVAWVVRNRVESGYRGTTYREVVLEPLQFSAFNRPSPRRAHILGLNQNSTQASWRQALQVALDVFQADPMERPFSAATRHFYSPVSMAGHRPPEWARAVEPLDAESLGVDPHRFLFFEDIDESGDPFVARTPAPADRIDTFQEETRNRLSPHARTRPRLRDRLKPSGRVPRPARPRATPARRTGW